MSMFCFQCEQTAKGTGCTMAGVCGKSADVAALQDLTVYACKGIAMAAHRARQLGAIDPQIDAFIVEAMFATLTNVNFDAADFERWLKQASEVLAKAKALYVSACEKEGYTPETLGGPAAFVPAATLAELIAQGQRITILKRMEAQGPDITGLQELMTYGLKGAAAYLDHAQILGKTDAAVYGTFHEFLSYLASEPKDVGELTGKCLAVGELNLKAMELLDAGNTSTYGHPEPTSVRVTPIRGKAIVVSGHDLADLEALLKQTEGKGINVYTHGEMLPTLAYPKLKAYRHLVGNYGGAWQDQRKEFSEFPGAILMTTNCIQKPQDSYIDRIFTSGIVGYPGVKHIGDRNFAPVIAAALAQPGFAEDAPEKKIMVGFARNAVMGVAGAVIDAVKAGKIRHFFLIGGCDGAKPGRNYYTEFAEAVPKDCVILTLACGKFRFNKLEFGDIGGIPRLLDVGQCNDAYSAIQIAVALAKAFETDVNGLPLSFILSWYEQKAVAILLTLLSLGVKKIKLGPSLPAFVSPAVLKVLVDTFDIGPVTTAQDDLKQALGQ